MDQEKLDLVKTNMSSVMEKMSQAARSVGREPGQVKLLAVTKKHPIEMVQAAILGGARLLGENYVEDAVPKINAISRVANLEWHMIGHVQSRKARLVCEHFDMVQSVDSIRLAERLNSASEMMQRVLPVLLEFKLSSEENKSGWMAETEEKWTDLLPELIQIQALDHLKVKGLMTVPPLFDHPELSRPYFQKLQRLRDFLQKKVPSFGLNELSMGTSADYEVAIQEGATMVRIGRAIFGPRIT